MEFVECESCGFLNPGHANQCQECDEPLGEDGTSTAGNTEPPAAGLGAGSDVYELGGSGASTEGSADAPADVHASSGDSEWPEDVVDDSEEADDSNKMPFPALVLMAFGITAGSYFGLAAISFGVYANFFRSYFHEHRIHNREPWLPEVEAIPGPTTFWVAFTALWLVGIFAGKFYEPKDNYDFGGTMGNPLSRRDDRDRRHAALGCLLLPLHLVRYFWQEVLRRLDED